MRRRSFVVPADDLPEPMLLVSPGGEVLATNRAATEDFGADAERDPMVPLDQLVTDAPEKVAAFLRLCSSTREALPGSLSFRTANGALDCRCDGHLTADGMVYLRCRPKEASNRAFTVLNDKIAELAREIAIRMRTEEQLQELLKSQEILIQELHHRIRNSIQVAIGLTGLQMRYAPEDQIRRQFLKHSQRLKAIGLVYRTLYRDHDLTRLDIREFVNELCMELRSAYRVAEVSFALRLDVTLLSLDQAVPFALIVNELVTNALVHACKPDQRGCVRVSLHPLPGERLELTIADDGKGIAPELLKPGKGGMGLNLVQALAKQLGASLEAIHSPGTTFRITFSNAGETPARS